MQSFSCTTPFHCESAHTSVSLCVTPAELVYSMPKRLASDERTKAM